MKTLTEYIYFNTKAKKEFINITREVSDRVSRSGIKEGMVLVSAMHITAGVFINDEEDGIKYDLMEWAEKTAPFKKEYRNHRTGESNADAHLKSTLFHHQVIVPITDGKPDLGPWQQIFYAEFDGQRRKKLIIKVMGQ